MAGLGQHQVDRGIAVIDDVLSGLGEVSLLGLDAEATGVSLVALALVELAARHDAQQLRVLGERILHVVAPEAGETHEAKQLADAEAAAEKATTLSLTPDGTGKVHGRFTIPELHAGMLRKFLMSLVIDAGRGVRSASDESRDPGATGTVEDPTDPAQPQPRPEPHRRATGHELGQAFCELLERLDGTGLPETAGSGATVVVTMSLEALTGGLAAATLDTGDRIAARTARRLACEAGIIPVVLGGKRQVLDQGRRRRRFTRAQRIALVVRDEGCTAVGCRTAAWFCHAHHDDPWARGGPTDLGNGRLLCPSHHRRIHDPAYDHHTTPHNEVEFTRRT